MIILCDTYRILLGRLQEKKITVSLQQIKKMTPITAPPHSAAAPDTECKRWVPMNGKVTGKIKGRKTEGWLVVGWVGYGHAAVLFVAPSHSKR